MLVPACHPQEGEAARVDVPERTPARSPLQKQAQVWPVQPAAVARFQARGRRPRAGGREGVQAHAFHQVHTARQAEEAACKEEGGEERVQEEVGTGGGEEAEAGEELEEADLQGAGAGEEEEFVIVVVLIVLRRKYISF